MTIPEGHQAVSTADLDVLLAVASLYVEAFSDDEMMTLPEKLRLQEVEDVLERHRSPFAPGSRP